MSRTPKNGFEPDPIWIAFLIIAGILLLIVLFGGEPDLMDAVVARVGGGS